jgi:hypothetical protein
MNDVVSIHVLIDTSFLDESWLIYRQALRDITEQTDPFNIVWAIKPEE